MDYVLSGEKWTGRNHECPTHIPIHVIQELMEVVQCEEEPDYDSSEEDVEASARQVIMAMQASSDLQKGSRGNRKLRFVGFIGQQEVFILLDSGSAGTFVSIELASKI